MKEVTAMAKGYSVRYSRNYYKGKDTPKAGKSLEGYAKRVHSIPLKDLFDVIRYIRTKTDFSTWLSNPDK